MTFTSSRLHAQPLSGCRVVADLAQIWGEEALQFQEKLLNSSGLGDETYFPDSALLSPAWQPPPKHLMHVPVSYTA